jgi:hypothetical protein
MVAARQLFTEPPVQWLAASPLWEPYNAIGQRPLVRRPEILRFASDTFMEDFIAVATTTPERLGEWHATRETWRKPAPTPPLRRQASTPPAAAVLDGATEDPTLADEPLKLYMPAHQRYYLVTASLVCRIPGLPDKMLNFSNGEQVSFVMRRRLRGQEHALVEGAWQAIDSGAETTLIPGELQHPMFPVTYREFDGYQRRLFAGLVPVSQRESLMTVGQRSAPALTSGTATASAAEQAAQLLTVLDVDVLSPWREINRVWAIEDQKITDSWPEVSGDSSERTKLRDSVNIARDKLQTQSWYTLLDLAYFLSERLPSVWTHINTSPDSPVPSGTPGKALIDALQAATFRFETSTSTTSETVLHNKLQGVNSATGATSMAKALRDVYAKRDFLESATGEYRYPDSDWPASTFLLCGINVRDLVDDLAALVADALEELPPDPQQRIPLVPLAAQLSETIEEGDYANDTFVIRCVFERPNCPPGVRPAVVSQPTEPFRLAAYFDPDAPMRPIRIPMPVDTSPAGLRKHARNTMFVLSDTLACQLEKARSITFGDLVLSVLPWPFHKDLPDVTPEGCESGAFNLGMLCTLSIPIITICALILLIIIVLLLDIIFKWIPYLIFCLPLPGLKAKD